MATKNNKTSPRAHGVDSVSAPEQEKTHTKAEPIITKDIDLHQYVTVRNGFQGELNYVSPKTGERFKWDGFGAEQEMELLELRNAKNASKKFFENNWFMFEEDWVVEYLGVRNYYKNAVKIEDFDKVFELSPSEIKKTISLLSNGQKKSIAYRAKMLIANGEIDSNKAIAALEDALGIELVER